MNPSNFNVYRQMPALDRYNNSEIFAIAEEAKIYLKAVADEMEEKFETTPFQKRIGQNMSFLLIAVNFAAKRSKETEELKSKDVVENFPTERKLFITLKKILERNPFSKKPVYKQPIDKKSKHPKRSSPKVPKVLKTGQICSHCNIKRTCQWRRCKSYGHYLCNSCGTFITKLEKFYSYENINIILDYLSDTPESRAMADVKKLISDGEIQLV